MHDYISTLPNFSRLFNITFNDEAVRIYRLKNAFNSNIPSNPSEREHHCTA
jgi:hypothetical protein